MNIFRWIAAWFRRRPAAHVVRCDIPVTDPEEMVEALTQSLLDSRPLVLVIDDCNSDEKIDAVLEAIDKMYKSHGGGEMRVVNVTHVGGLLRFELAPHDEPTW